MSFVNRIQEKAVECNKHIVLPEGTELRTLKAADIILRDKIARLTLLGSKEEIASVVAEHNLQHISKATIIDPKNNPEKKKYAEILHEIRKSKGLSMEDASALVEDPLYLAVLLIKNGDVDGEVAGADNATGSVLRPALQIVKTLPGISVVSGAFFMILKDNTYGENGILVFADCAVTPDPDEKQLAEIAVSSARTAKAIAGMTPKVAILSFSTKGSAKHPMVEKVINATKIAQEMAPEFEIDGELQADAAIIEAIGKKKAPDSDIAGAANILVFPSLEVGNISYKLVQRLANAEAIGPVLQGMAAPINDLSRGCSVDDIVNLVAITANQASVK